MKSIVAISKGRLWTSYVLQGLVASMFLMSAMNNLLQTEQAVSGAAEFGYPGSSVHYLGLVLLISTLLFVLPKTNVLGAGFLTAWLGGALATHVIHNDPMFNILFPVFFGIVLWLSLWLRNEKLRQLFPWSK